MSNTGAQIKDRLLLEEKKIEAFELRKNRENNRKFNKQVSELRKQEKSKDRKSNIAEVTQLRKEKGGDDGERASKLRALVGDDDKPQKSHKRQVMVRSTVAPAIFRRLRISGI